MKYISKANKVLIGLIIVGVITIVIGLTYAYFTAGITGNEETTTITAKSGNMKLVFNGGPDITNVTDMGPSTTPFATKTFTVTGTNTVGGEMGYDIWIIVDENTFTDGAISYTLEGTNVGGNGTLAPNTTERVGLSSTNKKIGTGAFNGKVTNSVHSYILKVYFYETGENQSEDMKKTFKSHLTIEEYIPTLGELILAQGVDEATILAKGDPNFAAIATATDTGLYASEDEYGTSYYYRGLKDNLNNNLIFAGFQWKIVRINGDGSIRIIYNGKCPNNTCIINNTHVDTDLGATSVLNTETTYTHSWNVNYYTDNKYLGYMYGGTNGTASGSKGDAQTNTTVTNAKTVLDAWYENSIVSQGSGVTSKIANNLFCNDRQSSTVTTSLNNGGGYGTVLTYYGAYYRLIKNKTPILKCTNKNDRFTVSETTIGNGALTYPVGLISADEASMAGLVFGIANSTNYLYTGQLYWAFSPHSFTAYADLFYVHSTGYLSYNYVAFAYGLRPLLNLIFNITVSGGNGSAGNPFVIL